MLEQVSKIDAMKTPNLPIDSAKLAASKASPESIPDFKSVLKQSLQAQNQTIPQAIAQTPKASLPASKSPSPANPTTSTTSTLRANTNPNNANATAIDSAKGKAAPISTPSATNITTKAASIPPSSATPATTTIPSTPSATSTPQASGALGSALASSSVSGQRVESTPAISNIAPKSPAQTTSNDHKAALLDSSSIPQPPQKKSLNDMAKVEPQESFLSKITQNAHNADSAIPAQPHRVDSHSNALEAVDSSLQAVQASGIAAAMLQDASPKDSNKPIATTSTHSDMPKPNTPTQASPTTQATKSTLGDVVDKAKDLGLNPGKVAYTQQDEEFKNSVQARTGISQPNASGDGIRQFFDKQDDPGLRPLFSMLSAAHALDAAARRSGSTPRVEYAIESKTEKIAIINRGKTLPRNITESRLKNERQERVFEQIQKDIIAGRELDLEQIKADLFVSKETASEPKIPAPQPMQTAQRLAGASAAIAAPALVQNAQETLKEAQKFSKDPKGQNPRTKSMQKDHGVASPQSSKDAKSLEPESSVQKDLARAMERESSPAEMDAMQELDSMPKELQEMAQAKTSKADKAGEQKSDAKLESKVATAASLGASAIKQDLTKPQVKEMIASFVNQFDQEVKKFKPPMNKISLELSPKELGNVELTITQRGKNLHVSVVSNPQAINVFAQNQLELRQNLIAQGFDSVDLNFSQNSGSQGGFSDSGQGSREDSGDQTGFEHSPQEVDSSMEIVIPLYA